MSLLKNFKFKAQVPDLEEYVGRSVQIPGEPQPIIIVKICGNVGLSMGREKMNPFFYEINGKYLINILRFHKQMTGDKSITEEQIRAFEEMDIHAEKMPEKKIMGQL